MTPEREAASGRTTVDVLTLFDRWLDLPESERGAELERIRQLDESAWHRLRDLIHADAEAQRRSFLDDSAVTAALRNIASESPEDSSAAGSRTVGPWTLLRSLGSGGVGRVWLASRNDGLYQGQVAIKMLRDAAADELAAERFRREGQILSRLSHPNIARLLDVGTLPDGQCYLVLEYVQGERIDHYCNARRTDINARIRLFDQVCTAVGYAHANLVVHRDLKPANILVEDNGTIKLLDFGVAKLLDDQTDVSAASPLTRLDGAGLTPEYAAPEQIEGGAITTATDIYSLGMVLYGLLCGNRPYGNESSSPARLARDIVEATPRTASTNFANPADSLAQTAAQNVGSTPERLRRQLRGDLDNILGRALKKRATERYGSVAALQADLSAYLADRPVAARPDRPGYRLRKFIHRNRAAVTGAVLTATLLIGAAAVTLWQARIAISERANAERQATIARQQAVLAESQSQRATAEARHAAEEEANARAQQVQAERYRASAQREAANAREQEAAARKQSQVARVEAAKAKAVKDFIVDIFRANLPASGDIEKAQQLTAKQLLETGTQRIAVKFADRPEVRAELLDTVGELFFRLGDRGRAKQLTLERIALLEQIQGEQAQQQLASVHNLSYIGWTAGDTATQREAVTQVERFADGGGRSEDGSQLLRRARIETYGRPAEALALASAAAKELGKDDHLVVGSGHRAGALEVVAITQALLGRYDLALAATEAVRQEYGRTLSKEHYNLAATMGLAGQIERAAGMAAKSERSLRTALSGVRRSLGRTHPASLVLQSQLGAVLHGGLRHPEGLEMLKDAVQRSARVVSRNAIDDARMRIELAHAWFDEGNFIEGEREVGHVTASLRDNPDLRLLLADARLLQSRFQSVRGQTDESLAAVDEALSIYADALGVQATAVGRARTVKAEILAHGERIADARMERDAAERITDGAGARFPILKIERDLLSAELALRRLVPGEAGVGFGAIVTRIDEDEDREYHLSLQARALLGLGRAQYMLNETQRARQTLERAVALHTQLGPKDSPWLAEARIALADVLIVLGDIDAARTLLDQAEAAFAPQAPLARYLTYPLEKVRQRLP